MKRNNMLALANTIEEELDWPWDMSEHATCAMGYLARMIGEKPGLEFNSRMAAAELGIPREDAQALFVLCLSSWAPVDDHTKITRGMMAEAIRSYVRTGKVTP